MGLEAATYISDLVTTNPVGSTDQAATGDDHIRLLKATLKTTFPNVTGAMTATHTELNLLVGKTATSLVETRNISGRTGTAKTISTSAPSGGADGDIWYRY